jgi:hypothetical protein
VVDGYRKVWVGKALEFGLVFLELVGQAKKTKAERDAVLMNKNKFTIFLCKYTLLMLAACTALADL